MVMKAKPLGNVTNALKDVRKRLARFLKAARRITARKPKTIADSIAILRELRRETYEDLNQLQHEYMVLEAIEWLIKNKRCPAETEWWCHLQQTSGHGEPDLCGIHEGRSIILAEVSASENPDGVIDQRIRKALDSLHQMPNFSKKFYFVRTISMKRRADTKVGKKKCNIKVVQLDI